MSENHVPGQTVDTNALLGRRVAWMMACAHARGLMSGKDIDLDTIEWFVKHYAEEHWERWTAASCTLLDMAGFDPLQPPNPEISGVSSAERKS